MISKTDATQCAHDDGSQHTCAQNIIIGCFWASLSTTHLSGLQCLPYTQRSTWSNNPDPPPSTLLDDRVKIPTLRSPSPDDIVEFAVLWIEYNDKIQDIARRHRTIVSKNIRDTTSVPSQIYCADTLTMSPIRHYTTW